MSLALSGIGVARGIAVGRAYILERGHLEVLEYVIPKPLIEDEVRRFSQAVEAAKSQLKGIRERIPANAAEEIAAFIDTHLLMMEDYALTAAPVELIRTRQCNAEWALKIQCEMLVDVFEEMDDAYLRTRKDDVIHVVNRIQRALLKQEDPAENAGSLNGAIIVADDLTPADTLLLQHEGVAAFVTEFGGPLSHTAIMARSLRIPSVVGMHHARRYLRTDEVVIVDGRRGVLVADPTTAVLEYYRKLQAEQTRYLHALGRFREAPAVSRDGQAVTLQANIELPDDAQAALAAGAAGIGLFRTEFLFMNRSAAPTEDEQFEAYTRVAEAMNGAPVTIRTLDLGADKSSGDILPGMGASNPALGLRAIRLCLKDPALFRPQVRAILRASASGAVRMMIPMLSTLQELVQVQRIVEECKRELRRAGLDYDPAMPMGGMIEVPAAAIASYAFARHLDFLSIGTNDLIQYTLAVDRVDDEMNYLYESLHPAVLRLIYLTLRSARLAGIPASLCGELASDRRYVRLLLGLGLRDFSMQPSAILEVKTVINDTCVQDLLRPARRMLRCHDTQQAHELLDALNQGVADL